MKKLSFVFCLFFLVSVVACSGSAFETGDAVKTASTGDVKSCKENVCSKVQSVKKRLKTLKIGNAYWKCYCPEAPDSDNCGWVLRGGLAFCKGVCGGNSCKAEKMYEIGSSIDQNGSTQTP